AQVVWANAEIESSVEGPRDGTSWIELPLAQGPQTLATIRIRTEGDRPDDIPDLGSIIPAWRSWATVVSSRAKLEERLAGLIEILKDRVGSEEPRIRQAKLEALGEFAAGAGHELNNPLAVIVGRAQLLLARENNPQAVRSLRAILTQAQRAHRILRDLMYVA